MILHGGDYKHYLHSPLFPKTMYVQPSRNVLIYGRLSGFPDNRPYHCYLGQFLFIFIILGIGVPKVYSDHVGINLHMIQRT